jgi:integrase
VIPLSVCRSSGWSVRLPAKLTLASVMVLPLPVAWPGGLPCPWNRGTVEVAEIVTEVGGVLRFGPPKTRAGRRTVGLPRAVVDELAAHLTGSDDPEALVFTAPQGGPLRVIAFRARVWRPATRKAELDGLRIHDLRHTAVALWIAAGASPKEVAALAGHTSVSFTLDRYGHLYPDSYATLHDRLDALHSSAQERDAEVNAQPTTARRQR